MKPTLIAVLTAAALSTHAVAQTPNADNTEKNTRDSSGETLTPIDQSNEPADLKITAETRKMVVGDDALSALAKNVKIITIAGVVTLRGPVDTAAEKAAIAKYAETAGATSVQNQLEIKQDDSQ